MAKLASLLKIEGTLDGMTFYKGPDGEILVKKKSGVSKNRIANDPAFIRTRENGREFGHVAACGKMFRRALNSVLYDVKDRSKTARLTQALAKVKNQDTTSIRGERKVHLGIQTQEAKDSLRYFDFNKNAPLTTVLKEVFVLDTVNAEISIPQFNPERHLGKPQGATHVEISAAHLKFDFETGEGELVKSNIENILIEDIENPVTLSFSTNPSGPGNDYYLMKVVFYQTLNNSLYPLNNGIYNALQLIEIV